MAECKRIDPDTSNGPKCGCAEGVCAIENTDKATPYVEWYCDLNTDSGHSSSAGLVSYP